MHHIFFPPRLEVVAEQQNTDGFSAHAWNQFAFHGFFSHQPDGPAGVPFGRVAANHGDNSLFLAVLQQRRRAGPLLFIESTLEPPFLVAMTNFPNCLRRQRNRAGNTRCADPFGKLQ